MTRHITIAVAIACAMLLGGCNKKTESAASSTGEEHKNHRQGEDRGESSGHQPAIASGTTQAPVSKEAPLSPEAEAALSQSATPDQVVKAFLEATRSGDEVLASKLLSRKALEATTRAGLIVKPPGTPSMQYEIGSVEYPPSVSDGAYVQSIWREHFDDGEDRFDITWVLRKQPEGWRIVGMALPGDDLVNFEEPDVLRQKMDEAIEESEAGEPASTENEVEELEEEKPDVSTAERTLEPRNALR